MKFNTLAFHLRCVRLHFTCWLQLSWTTDQAVSQMLRKNDSTELEILDGLATAINLHRVGLFPWLTEDYTADDRVEFYVPLKISLSRQSLALVLTAKTNSQKNDTKTWITIINCTNKKTNKQYIHTHNLTMNRTTKLIPGLGVFYAIQQGMDCAYSTAHETGMGQVTLDLCRENRHSYSWMVWSSRWHKANTDKTTSIKAVQLNNNVYLSSCSASVAAELSCCEANCILSRSTTVTSPCGLQRNREFSASSCSTRPCTHT